MLDLVLVLVLKETSIFGKNDLWNQIDILFQNINMTENNIHNYALWWYAISKSYTLTHVFKRVFLNKPITGYLKKKKFIYITSWSGGLRIRPNSLI